MRQLDEHKVNPANDTLTIEVVDEEGAGGPINEVGVNGVTQEVLLLSVCAAFKKAHMLAKQMLVL